MVYRSLCENILCVLVLIILYSVVIGNFQNIGWNLPQKYAGLGPWRQLPHDRAAYQANGPRVKVIQRRTGYKIEQMK